MLKGPNELSYIREHYHCSFKIYISENEIIEYLLKRDFELKNAYSIYQEFLYSLNKEEF